MVLVTDDMVQNTFKVMEDTGVLDNTVVLFSADNGGNPTYGGYNMPLRGRKGSVFEGGIRSAAFVWGQMIPKEARGTTYQGLIHLTDWLPTFMGLATGAGDEWLEQRANTTRGADMDGVNVWAAMVSGEASPRTQIMHNLDSSGTWGSAIRVGDYKLIVAQAEMEWFPIPDSASSANQSVDLRDVSQGSWETRDECTGSGRNKRCNYLFNIKSDPTETTNLITAEPERAAALQQALDEYKSAEAPCGTCGVSDPAAEEAAKANGGFWTPWLGTKPKPTAATNTDTYASSDAAHGATNTSHGSAGSPPSSPNQNHNNINNSPV